ncbi:MAG TPA: aminoglycoside phosphotransferase family protein [Acidimicrobiales bacterium]|nr:aminoglycoside phosphotransferase family protein [Acidimicrobiales bacterium]
MELTDRDAGTPAARAVLGAAQGALGPDIALAGPPAVVAGGFGRGAYECALAVPGPPPWDGPVVVRVGATAAAARREAAWHGACAAHGCPVPPVLAVVEGEDGAAVVVARGPARSLVEVLGENPLVIPELLRSMAAVHARLRAIPTSAAPPGTPSATVEPPLDVLDARLAARGLAERFGAERSWLAAHEPPPAPPAVCHGDFQPAVVRLDASDVGAAVVVDWSSARLADPEYDLALTTLMFWSVPYLADGIAQRKMLKTVREMIVDGYRAAYEAAAGPLDPDRLRYWGAYHALGWAARLAAAERDGPPADPWDPMHLVHHAAAYRKDLARRLGRLASD